MKALSIKQPYASLICTPREDNPLLGVKDIENRTFRTHYRGVIYIHASAKWHDRTKSRDSRDLLTPKQYNSIPHELAGKFLDRGIIVIDKEIPVSAIIGEVEIIDCVINHPSIWAEKMETHICEETGINILDRGQKYIWNWVLANPVLYDKPILNIKGKLSFWEFEGCKHKNCNSSDGLDECLDCGVRNY